MSVSFFCPDEPKTDKEEYDCQCEGSNPTCMSCNGTGKVVFHYAPSEFNMANSNARELIELLGIEFEYYGEIAAGNIPVVKRRAMKALNVEARRAPHVRETRIQGNFYSFGINDEYLRDKLSKFIKLCSVAQRLNSEVLWG